MNRKIIMVLLKDLELFRAIIRNIVSIFYKSDNEVSTKSKLRTLRETIANTDNEHYNKTLKFFENN